MTRSALTERAISFSALCLVSVAAPALAAGTAPAVTVAKCNSVATCVFGENAGAGNGAEGRSAFGDGVIGRTSAPATSPQTARAGVAGLDTSGSSFNYGVLGTSSAGDGVAGSSTFSTGVYGSSDSGTGIVAQSRSGVGLLVRSTAADEPALVIDAADTVALSAQAAGPNASGAYISAGNTNQSASSTGLVVTLAGGGGTALASSLVAGGPKSGPQPDHYDAYTNGDGVASLDRSGDLALAGTLSHAGTALATASGPSGVRALTYGERTSAPALDDMGEGRLVRGAAYVPLDATFAALIAPQQNYLVFITPRGESNGLYVTTVTQRGFAVRESSSGHATIAFDYRIVAQPYDTKRAHLAPTTTLPAFKRHAYPLLRQHA
jgi:hypothetical protein